MTDYDQIYKTAKNEDFLGRIDIAVVKAAEAIINESDQTANHANRYAWSRNAIEAPREKTLALRWRILMNPTIQTNMNQSPDADIQFVVNGMIDYFATGS